ncbi:MAG: hypothetical protein PUA85_05565 [Oscillospiraceae bacterium]|nr:hypothetical protein [Oscillospiraceae bacterium]
MEKLTCIMDCKKETKHVRFLAKTASFYIILAGIISFVGTILSIVSLSESRADSFSEILYAFLPTIISTGICIVLAELFLALAYILQELTTSARIAELRASSDCVTYHDKSNDVPYYRKNTGTNNTADKPFEAHAPSWICPKCGERSIGGFCKKCGEKSPYAKAESTKIKAGTWKCPNCGKTYMNSVSRCSCGFEKES